MLLVNDGHLVFCHHSLPATTICSVSQSFSFSNLFLSLPLSNLLKQVKKIVLLKMKLLI